MRRATRTTTSRSSTTASARKASCSTRASSRRSTRCAWDASARSTSMRSAPRCTPSPTRSRSRISGCMNLALFDLDNTLLNGDTDFEWLEFLIEQGAVSQEERAQNLAMDARYRTGEAEPLEYVRFYLRFYPPHD